MVQMPDHGIVANAFVITSLNRDRIYGDPDLLKKRLSRHWMLDVNYSEYLFRSDLIIGRLLILRVLNCIQFEPRDGY